MKTFIAIILSMAICGTAFASIIIQTQPNNYTPSKPTILTIVMQDKARISQLYAQIKAVIASVYADIWNNKYGYTPVQMFDGQQGGWGIDAQQLLGVFSAEIGIVQSVDNSYIAPTETIDNITPNNDGSVSLTEVNSTDTATATSTSTATQ